MIRETGNKDNPPVVDIWQTSPLTGAYVFQDSESRVRRIQQLLEAENSALDKAKYHWRCTEVQLIVGGLK